MGKVRPTTPRRAWGRLHDSPMGLCEVSADGLIESITGGAMALVGTNPEEWIGTTIPDAYMQKGLLPALAGRSTLLDMPSVTADGHQTLVHYTPRYDSRGAINGAVIWWMVVPKHQKVSL